jgi:predicted DNA-binding transcriptional regulator AlpA
MPYDAHSRPELRHDRLYNAREVCALLGGIHISTLYAWRRNGNFPEPQRIGPRTVRWTGSQIIEHRAASAAKSAGIPKDDLPW